MSGDEGQPLSVRRATESDAPRLFEWANDAETRAQSFSSAPILWDGHVAWLTRKLGDRSCHLYVVEVGGAEPVATVRFDTQGGHTDVSVTVAPAARGRRLAARAISAAVHAIFESTDIQGVRAFIKPDNTASVRAFERAGFVSSESPRADARCFVRARSAPRG